MSTNHRAFLWLPTLLRGSHQLHAFYLLNCTQGKKDTAQSPKRILKKRSNELMEGHEAPKIMKIKSIELEEERRERGEKKRARDRQRETETKRE